jgi:hypothetical protein
MTEPCWELQLALAGSGPPAETGPAGRERAGLELTAREKAIVVHCHEVIRTCTSDFLKYGACQQIRAVYPEAFIGWACKPTESIPSPPEGTGSTEHSHGR